MRWTATIGLAALALAGCGGAADDALPNQAEANVATDEAASAPETADTSPERDAGRDSSPGDGAAADDGDNGDAPGASLPPAGAGLRFVGRWASEAANCGDLAWRFTADRLETPAGSVCTFTEVEAVPGGYDIAATCTAEAPPAEDRLEIRFAESAKAMLFESDSIADAGLIWCGRAG